MFDFDELEDAEEAPAEKTAEEAEPATVPEPEPLKAAEKAPEKVEAEPATVPEPEPLKAEKAPEKVEAEPATVPEPEPLKAAEKVPEKVEEPVAEVPELKAPAGKVPEKVEAEQPAVPPPELPNAKYSPDMVLECVGAVLMRQQEDLESPQVARLAAGCLVKVLELGTGPSGKRIMIHAASGEEGWASVIASNSAAMFRSTLRPWAAPATPVAATEATTVAATEAKAEPKAAPATSTEMPWSSIRPGDTCVCKTSVVMRREEDMDSEMMRRLPAGEELEILKSGTEPTGRRFKAKDSQGNRGWISALSKDGAILLDVTQRGNQSLYVGTGQALGGDSEAKGDAAPMDRRAAQLAAAEKRQAMFMNRGVKAAKNRDIPREDAPVPPPSESRTDFKPPARESQVAPAKAAPKAAAAAPAALAAASAPVRQGPDKQKEEAAWSQGLTNSEVQEVFDLEALGFDFYQALHAFATHRNKEVAANILLESQEEPAAAQLPVNVQFRPLPAAFPGPALNESQLGFSPFDLQKVQRLMNLGFDRPTAVKALYHCNRDEELAGNQLLS